MPDDDPSLTVTSIRGRYPNCPRVLCSHNMVFTVHELEPGEFVLRIEDRTAMEFWLHLVLELRGEK